MNNYENARREWFETRPLCSEPTCGYVATTFGRCTYHLPTDDEPTWPCAQCGHTVATGGDQPYPECHALR